MKTALLNLPWSKDGRLGVRAGSRWPFTSKPAEGGRLLYIPFPFFLAYTAALFEKEGRPVVLIDAIAEGMSESLCMEKIGEFDPGLILSETSAPSFNNDMRILGTIRQSLRNVKIGLCGAHAGEFASKILTEHDAIDYVIVGEYERSAVELADALERGDGWGDVDGLAYRSGDKILLSARRGRIDPLDVLPWPKRTAPSIYQYKDGFAGLPVPSVQMLTSRGCPFHCSFCLLPQTLYQGSGYRKRNFLDVVDEMEYLIRQFDFKSVYFDDETFNGNREHVVNICREIIRRELHVPWGAMTRADRMDEALLELMARAGVYAVKYGIESADETVRRSCGKDLDLEKVRSVIRISKRLGVKVHLTFCVGLPGETEQTVQRTIDFVRSVEPDSVQFSFAVPFPGTAYFREVVGKGWLVSDDWEDYDGNRKCIVRTQDLSPQDLENIKATLHALFADSCDSRL